MLKPAETTPVFTSLTNWKTLEQLVNDNPQFTYSQLKRLFWKRDEHHGLNQCVKRIGRKLYINEPAFALHTAARLAELHGVSTEDLAGRCADNARRLFGFGV